MYTVFVRALELHVFLGLFDMFVCLIFGFTSQSTMKLGSKYNLLKTPANFKGKKDPMKALGRIDFTKCALSTIIYLMQPSENG